MVGPLALALAVALPQAGAEPAPRPSGPSLELRVQRAIARGVGWLQRAQRQDGTFAGHERAHPGGATALAGLTLLKSGVPAEDIAVQACARALEPVAWKSTYSAAVHLLFLEALHGPSERTAVPPSSARGALELLVRSQLEGVWGYPADPLDLSNTQFALLGLRAASRLGLDVPARTIEQAARALARWQSPEGGYPYQRELEPTGGMTAAALGGFAILGELGARNAAVREVLEKGKPARKRAEAWLDARFSAARNPYGDHAWTSSFQYAYLWAVERWCGFTGRERIGGRDWYDESAAWLLGEQKPDGAWGASVEEACFALLVLRRATVTGAQDLRALWAQLDREKEQAAARPGLECAREVPRVTGGFLAGPFRDGRGAPALRDPPFDPGKIEPRERAKVSGQPLQRIALKPDGWTELEDFAPAGSEHQLWVFTTKVAWELRDGAALEARFWVQAEDGWRLFLDGAEVGRSARVQSAIEELPSDPVVLRPGEHRLVVLVSDVRGASAFGLRVSRDDGTVPPPGLAIGAELPKAHTPEPRR